MTKKPKPKPLGVEPPRLLHRDSGYVDPCPVCKGKGRIHDDPCTACNQTGTKDPEQAPGYTTNPGSAMFAEPEAVPKEVQVEQSKEGRRRYDESRADELLEQQAKVIANKLAKLQREGAKLGVDFAPRLQAFIKDAQAELVEQRRKAA